MTRYLVSAILVGLVAAPRLALTYPMRTLDHDPVVHPNRNLESAGTLHRGVLAVTLVAQRSLWRFSSSKPPQAVATFSERGGEPLMPGPLLRVPIGTELRLTLQNALPVPLTFVVPAALSGGPDRLDAMDSVVVAPGSTGLLTARATVAGNYIYRGKLPDGPTKVSQMAGVLAGAIVVDTAGAPAPPRDRVLVILATEDSASAACDDSITGSRPLAECSDRHFIFTLNGEAWPNTERMHATAGDTLRWRVINASFVVHPMHLHGFYYRVDDFSGPRAAGGGPPPGRMVVTQLMSPLASMSITWVPSRPGNWLFHCHFALHNTPYTLDAAPDDPDLRGMVGLVLGTIVTPRPGAPLAAVPAPARTIRLVAETSAAKVPSRDTVPDMRFAVEENGHRIDSRADWSPEIDLERGVPVAITVVNHLGEPTSVHWHGVEVQDSYADGAAGFSGDGTHLTPEIAPGDSFVARFAPPRAGSFMYHAHMDEERQEAGGLQGALIVRDSSSPPGLEDRVFLLKGTGNDPAHLHEIDGEENPDTVVLQAGRTARLRLMNLTITNPEPTFALTARPDSVARGALDTMLVSWRPIAKDGFDLPGAAETARPARQVVAIGETYDFVYTPEHPGLLRLEVRATRAPYNLVARVPIRVE
ncbi:MAG TPA: multicopper oxidase domain-containing protein [Gemmatimonadales bacterium]|nr:multicopper oxidase domain-containing protein [Gemmatimonadales bacterium]